MTFYKLIPLLSLCLFVTDLAKADEKSCIAVIVSGSESRPFWSSVIAGAVQAGNELGVKIHARGTVNDKDDKGQKRILYSILKKHHCNGVVIAPSDVSRNEDVYFLKQKGIPTVYVDRDTGGERIASIKTDNQAAGMLAATKLSKALKGKKRVILFRLQKGVTSTDARELGFTEKAEELGLNIVASPYLGSRVGTARQKAQETLRLHPNIDGIFTPNDTTTVGVIKARETYGKNTELIHIGFDENDVIIENLKKGKLSGYLTQSPFEMGYQAIYTLQHALINGLPANDITTQINYHSN